MKGKEMLEIAREIEHIFGRRKVMNEEALAILSMLSADLLENSVRNYRVLKKTRVIK